jgi:hypothetical protein
MFLFILIKRINNYFILPVPLQKVQITSPLPLQNAHSPISVLPLTQATQLFSPLPSQTQQSFELPLPMYIALNKIIVNIDKIDLVK